MIVEIERNRWLVSTTCHECFIDVEAFAAGDQTWKGINIGLLSKHAGQWERGIRGRIKRAWRILRGEADDFIELVDAREADDLIEAMIDARIEAFGDPTPETQEAIRTFGQG